jgi:DNA-binding PadR family transcriptional regulator
VEDPVREVKRQDERVTDRVNATAAALLGLLHDGPLSGWDLVRTAKQRLGDFWSVTQSQVYRELAALDRAGLVEAGDPGVRDRRGYTITDRGREAFSAFLHAAPGPETIRYPLLLTLAFGDHLEPAALRALLADQRRVHEERLRGYLAQQDAAERAGADPRRLAPLRFGIRHERATLEWFDDLTDLEEADQASS